jgi:long-chain acyl-CoA synthetase
VSQTELLTRFADVCRDHPARPLIHHPASGASFTADAIWSAHLELAETLVRSGVSPGHLVVSAVGNGAASVPLLLACRAIGAALMPVDAGATRVEIEALAERFAAAAIVSQSPADRLSQPSAASPGVRTETANRRLLAEPRQYCGVAVLKLTSGSTGAAKAALTTEAQLVADATHIIAAMGIRPDDTQIAAIPVSHSYGLGNLMLPLLLQGTALVLRDSFVPQLLPGDARRFGARLFPGVPFMFDYFLAHPPAERWPAPLRLLISAGAPLAPATARGFRARFGVKVHTFYGASETGGIAYDDTEEVDDAAAVGHLLPGVSVTLRNADCGWQNDDPQFHPRSATRNPQREGRIHVVSDAVASGYCDGDGGAFVDGGFLTGDFGAFDACARLVLVGRVSSFVNVAGRKVQPDEVERVLRAMPGIADVRVVAAADERRGQQLVACIVATESNGLTPLAVRRFCASRLAPYKVPRAVVFLDIIPLTPRGKTDRIALDELVRARIGR